MFQRNYKHQKGFLWFLLKLSTLFLYKLQLLGKFYPLVFAGYLDGAAFELTQDVGAVVGDSAECDAGYLLADL